MKYSFDIFNSLSDDVLVIDKEHHIVFANRAILRTCGLDEREVLGQKCYEFAHRCDVPCEKCLNNDVICPHEKVFKNGVSISAIHHHKMPDGTEKTFEVMTSPIRDEKGDIVQMVEVLRDVTEREQADKLVRESEEYLRTILDSVHFGIVIIDLQTHKIADLNAYALKMIGAGREQVIGNICHGYICPAEIGKCPITDLEQTIDLSDRELINAGGDRIPILKNVVPVMRNRRGYLIESFVDITARKKAEQKLKESEIKLHSILEGIGDGVMVIDRDFRIISSNKGCCDQVRMSHEDMIGRYCYEVSHRYTKPCYEMGEECSVKNTFETGISHRIIHTHYDSEGSQKFIETISYPLKDTSGNIVSAIEVLSDVTQRILLDQELKNKVKDLEDFYDMAIGRELRMMELKEELEKLKEELEKLKEELEKLKKS